MLYNFLLTLANILYRIIFNFKVHGRENYESIKNTENIIICSNHKAYFDPITVALSVDRTVHFMAKKELFDVPVLGFIVKRLNAFPVTRGKNDMKALKTAVNLVKEGKILGIFIEGTRVKEYNIKNAKTGPVVIAKMSKATILPIFIDTDYKFFQDLNVYIREPIEIDLDKFDGSKNFKYKKQAEIILDKIYNG